MRTTAVWRMTHYTAWLKYDITEEIVVQGVSDGASPPRWSYGEAVPEHQRERLNATIDRLWREIGGHLGHNTVCEMVTVLELLSLEVIFPVVVPGETRTYMKTEQQTNLESCVPLAA